MKLKTRTVVQAAVIAAVYASLTLLIKPLAYGPIQFRISEVLTVLPAVLPASIPGLFVGCVLANFLGGFGMADIVFGSLATLLAGFSTWLLKKRTFLLPLPPVVFNGLIVGTYVYLLYDRTYPWPLTMLLSPFRKPLSVIALAFRLLPWSKKTGLSVRRLAYQLNESFLFFAHGWVNTIVCHIMPHLRRSLGMRRVSIEQIQDDDIQRAQFRYRWQEASKRRSQTHPIHYSKACG